MKDFPNFMKNEKNHISSDQYMKNIEGYCFEGNDGSQMAFWNFYSDNIIMAHKHKFDEYVFCICGKYIVIMNGKEVILDTGQELLITKETVHGGVCTPGTRTIHAFGGERISNDKK